MSTSIRNVGATGFGVNGSAGASPRTPAVGPLGGAGPRQPPAFEALSRSFVDLGVAPPLAWEIAGGDVPAVPGGAGGTVPATLPEDLGEPAVGERPDDGAERPRVADKPSTPRTVPDRFERAARPAARPAANPAARAAVGDTTVPSQRAVTSPFVEVLARGTGAVGAPPPPLPPLGAPQADPSAAAHLPYSQLGQLGSFAGTLAASGSPAPRRIYLGSMLVMSDAQRHDLPGLEPMATVILRGNLQATSEHFARWLRSSDRVLAAAQQNVAALVQQVLRESYLMTTDVLMDYAEKVKFYNEQKKKVRDLLDLARKTRASWAGSPGAQPGAAATSPDPFLCKDVDPITGEIFVQKLSAGEAKAETAARTASAVAKDAGYAALMGSSGLSETDRTDLDEFTRDHGITLAGDDKSDNFICDNLDRLLEIVPRMNKDDLLRYLPPILDALITNSTDSDAVARIYEALTPAQALYVDAHLTPALGGQDFLGRVDKSLDWGFGKIVDSIKHVDTLVNPVKALGFFHSAVTVRTVQTLLQNGLSDDAKARVSRQLAKCRQQAQDIVGAAGGARDSQSLLAALDGHAKAEPSPSAPSPAVAAGSPKQVTSTDGLDAYIKGLEEKLNGLGDDAQLANVDLQNELQKQQQTLQMMSNISKMLYDTAMAVVRKISG